MHLKTAFILYIGLNVILAGCAGYSKKSEWPISRPLGSDFSTFHPPIKPDDKSQESLPTEEPTGTITLRQALAAALLRNPELASFSWEIRAQEAATLQAGLLPNPEAGATIEDIGLGRSQTTLQLGQLIELGGKRGKRVDVTSLTRDLAGWDYETKRIAVFTQVSQAFVDVLSAQQNLALIEETVRLSKQVAGVVSERVRAGKVSPIEETRANVTLSAAQIELDRVQRQSGATRKRLAATWGSIRPQFEGVEGDLSSVSPIPTLEFLAQRLSQNPELARWAVEISQRGAVIALERSQAVPDLFISGGVRRFRDTNDNAFLVGVTIPLPIFNRNQGRILEAEHRLRRAEEERRAAEVRVTTALAEAYRALSTSHAEVRALEANVLPGAESAFEAVNEGYRLGKFGLLDVLDAQRTLFGSRAQYLSALRGYHQAVAEVEGLIGEPLNAAQNRPEQNNRSDH